VQFFEFLKNQQFGFFKYSRTKELLVSLLFKQFPNQRTAGHGYFKNLKELAVFMKELVILCLVL
jgi:hypothetical protein